MELTLPRTRTPLPARELLHTMALAREGDRREGILLRQNKGWFQVSGTGHEALAALAHALRPDDYVFPYYRDRALVLARGVPNYDLALAYFARRGSGSGGRQMPGHFSDRERNIFSVATPTASQCLPAAGAAWGFRLAGTDQVALTTVGDAATRQGEFYEAIALALQESLPLVFVIEDNRFGISTPTERFFPYRLGALGTDHMVRLDGRDAFAVYEAGSEAVEKARRGDGPTVLWCELDRLCSHTSSDDHRVYRAPEDIACDLMRDPIDLLARRLVAENALTLEEWDAETARLARQVDDEYRAAETAPDPDPGLVESHMFGPPAAPKPPPVSFPGEATMVAAVNATLRKALETDDRVLLCGEDIADPKGGVFGLTKGLSTDYPDRVFNAPLAEASIIGSAVGLAATGWKPVFELQFVDFLPPGLNQLMTHVSTLRWRSAGAWSCPLVLFAPYGAYLPGGSLWHSESNEGMWAHIHGVNVAIPSTPEDAAGLLWAALHGSDPTLFLLPKHVFRKRMPVSPAFEAVPFGRARVVRAGHDVTLVTWGNCVELCEEAADHLHDEGVSAEVIDLRTIVPCDWHTVEESLKNTGRLVVVHEDSRTCGFGQAVVTEMVSVPERFNLLLSPPQLVARKDVPIGYNPILEYAALPSVADVMTAARLVME